MKPLIDFGAFAFVLIYLLLVILLSGPTRLLDHFFHLGLANRFVRFTKFVASLGGGHPENQR